MPVTGTLLCLASAVAFGAMGIFGKLAYDDGATVGTLLAVRFLLAAALFWMLVAGTGAARQLRALSRRDVGLALALGRHRLQRAGRRLFRRAQRLDASLLSLLVYTFPAMVTVAAIALGRERASSRRAVALAALVGRPRARAGRGGRGCARSARRRCWGFPLPSSTAATSSRSAGVAERVGPLVLSALVCTGAARDAHAGERRRRRPAPGTGERGGPRAGWRASRSSRPSPPSACSSPACGASARRRRRSSLRPSR